MGLFPGTRWVVVDTARQAQVRARLDASVRAATDAAVAASIDAATQAAISASADAAAHHGGRPEVITRRHH